MDDTAMRRSSRRTSRDDGGPFVNRVLAGHFELSSATDTVRPQGSREWLVIYTAGGQGRLWPHGGEPILLPPGSVVAYAPGAPQRFSTDPSVGRWELLWVHAHPRSDWGDLLDWPPIATGVSRLDLSPTTASRVHDALLLATAHHQNELPRSTDFVLNAVEQALLWCSTENPRQNMTTPIVRSAVEYAVAHLHEFHTVTSLARHVGASPSHLAHTFSREFGISPMNYVQGLRMSAARDLLTFTHLSVTEVARRVGYVDPLYFSRRFRLLSGSTPTAFRRAAIQANAKD